MTKFPLNPKKELMRWGPVTLRYYYISDFDGMFKDFPRKYKGEFWPKSLIILKKEQVVWVNQYDELRKQSISVFKRYMLPVNRRKKVWDDWMIRVKELQKIESRIDRIDLSGLPQRDFLSWWREFNEVLLAFWVDGVIPEIANYGADKVLEKELGKYIKDQIELSETMEVLTSPEELSFYQKEELDLVDTQDLKNHTKKYFWIKNSYAQTSIQPLKFFESRKSQLNPDLKNKLALKKAETRRKKRDIKIKYRLSDSIMQIADTIVKGIEWQDTRKKHILIYLHYKTMFLHEASRRLSIPIKRLYSFSSLEIIDMLEGKIDTDKYREREVGFAIIINAEKRVITDSKTAAEYWQEYAKESADSNIKEFTGVVVSKGKGLVRGRVRIILDPLGKSFFKKGEILVAPMTSPEYIFIMKKSSAIITDNGGITSHAAIVSRELNKPCLVGTRIATQVLRDGDLVEVDAVKGVVKIITNK